MHSRESTSAWSTSVLAESAVNLQSIGRAERPLKAAEFSRGF